MEQYNTEVLPQSPALDAPTFRSSNKSKRVGLKVRILYEICSFYVPSLREKNVVLIIYKKYLNFFSNISIEMKKSTFEQSHSYCPITRLTYTHMGVDIIRTFAMIVVLFSK